MFVSNHKQILRQKLLQLREQSTPAMKLAVMQQIQSFVSTQTLDSVGVYWPIKNELDVLAPCLAVKTIPTLALPCCLSKTDMEFRVWQPEQALVRDYFDIPCPSSNNPTIVPSVCLVPCLGVSPDGFRLGYGAGFYDRYIQHCRQHNEMTTFWGVILSCQIMDIPTDAHDMRLDGYISEQGITYL